MNATSSYLNRKPRTELQACHDAQRARFVARNPVRLMCGGCLHYEPALIGWCPIMGKREEREDACGSYEP